jgi:hypothetical protein
MWSICIIWTPVMKTSWWIKERCISIGLYIVGNPRGWSRFDTLHWTTVGYRWWRELIIIESQLVQWLSYTFSALHVFSLLIFCRFGCVFHCFTFSPYRSGELYCMIQLWNIVLWSLGSIHITVKDFYLQALLTKPEVVLPAVYVIPRDQ